MTAHLHERHAHGVGEDADARRLARGLALIVVFMAAEIVAGILAHSLALLSDAAHMLTDAGALLLSIAVLRLARRPAGGNVTFGLRRLEALSAQANGALLLVLAGLIVYGGIHRLVTPPSPGGLTIVVVAAVGIVVNLLATRELARANRESLNVEGAFQHLLTDLFAFVATGAAGAVILATGYGRADGIAALLIAAIMIRAGVGLLRASGRVLLEIAPERVSVDDVGRELARYGLVVVVAWIGLMKFTAYEAAGIQPLVANSPLMGWMYGLLSVRAFSNLLGTVEIAVAVMIALRPVSPRIAAVGSATAVMMFLTTLSFLFSTPGWEPSLGGFPALSVVPGQFLLKDVVLPGAAVCSLGEALRA